MEKLRILKNLSKFKFNDEGVATLTSIDQKEVEKSVDSLFRACASRAKILPYIPYLLRFEHEQYLRSCIKHLSSGYECLDASRTWLCYWILHSLALLDVSLESKTYSDVVQFLNACQNETGGFGGGPGQYSHLAPTYAAVNAICIIGTDEAYSVINRERLQEFLWTVRSSNGAFKMHADGEVDVRGVYCALAIATLTNIYSEELFEGTAEWVASCQTYEGGFGGCPGMEAHGGYAFCGLAALVLLRKTHLCDLKSFTRWLVNRQMKFEGGFQGRTNKLVDGCYSFWQGASFPLVNSILLQTSLSDEPDSNLLMDQEALQQYILVCCQNASGGLLDKPGKPRDLYHTCYALSGLSIAQQTISGNSDVPYVLGRSNNEVESRNYISISGFISKRIANFICNQLGIKFGLVLCLGEPHYPMSQIAPHYPMVLEAPTHPVYNICPDYAYNSIKHYKTMPKPEIVKTPDESTRSSSRSSEASSESEDEDD